jgi:hypothetical protein
MKFAMLILLLGLLEWAVVGAVLYALWQLASLLIGAL